MNRSIFILAALALLPASAGAAPPELLNHQGRIAVGGVNFDGTGYFKFALLNPDTPETFWTNDGTNTGRPGGEPTQAVPAAVSKGHFSILLGDTSLTNMDNIVPASLFEDEGNLVLRIWFATRDTGPFELLTPDRRLTPAPYALHAATAGGVTDGSITSAMLAKGSVTSDQLADRAVGVENLATEESYGPFVTTINNPSAEPSDGFGYSVAGVGADKLLVGAWQDNTGAVSAGSAYLFDTSGNLLATMNNPVSTSIGFFGRSVAGVGADKLLVGAPYNETGNVGSAYLFDDSGNLLATLDNPSPDLDSFGFSVAGVGTDKLLVGAFRNNTGVFRAGSAYLFDDSGTLLATIDNPSPADGDDFGFSVAGVGIDRLLIGAPSDDTGAGDAGLAYLYDTSGNLLAIINNPDPDTNDHFGYSVAGVGSDKLLIGAYGNNSGVSSAGSAYLFDTAGNLLATIDNPDPASNDQFGRSVAGVGADKLLIGANRDGAGASRAGSAYLYDTSGNLLATIANPAPAEDDFFGFSVAGVGSDKLLIAAPSEDTGAFDSGSVYLFPPAPTMPDLLSGGVVGGAISSANIADGTIVAADLAPGASDDADADPANELQSLSLLSDTLSLSNSNSVSLDQYLRSNNSDIYSGETLFFGTGSTLSVIGKFEVTGESSSDDDSIYFNSGSQETLTWVNAQDRFEFSENLEINSGGNAPQLRLEQTSNSNFARLELATVDGGNWQIVAQGGATGDLRFWNGSTNRMVLEDNGDLFIDGSLNPPSDRDKKENFEAVDPAEVLEKVAAMEITRWNYKHDDNDTPHLGPVAQDFHAAFGLGADDKHIATVDADGVALAAIQALNTKLESENAELRARLSAIEELLKSHPDLQP